MSVVLLGGGQEIFIFKGGCLIRGVIYHSAYYDAGRVYQVIGRVHSGGVGSILLYIVGGCPVGGVAHYVGGESTKLNYIKGVLPEAPLTTGNPADQMWLFLAGFLFFSHSNICLNKGLQLCVFCCHS